MNAFFIKHLQIIAPDGIGLTKRELTVYNFWHSCLTDNLWKQVGKAQTERKLNQNQRICWLPEDSWVVEARLVHINIVNLMLLSFYCNSSDIRPRLFLDMNKIELSLLFDRYSFLSNTKAAPSFCYRKKIMPTLHGSRKKCQKHKSNKKNPRIAIDSFLSKSKWFYLHLSSDCFSIWFQMGMEMKWIQNVRFRFKNQYNAIIDA